MGTEPKLYEHERLYKARRDAADELYEALEHIRELLTAYGPQYIGKAIKLADVALAKARGE